MERKGLGVGMHDYHSLSWLLYESLQQGRYQRAREALDLIKPAVEATGASRLKALQSDMRARYVVETRSFQELAGTRDFGTTSELFAIGMSAARRGDTATLGKAITELKRRAGSRATSDFQGDVAVMEKELSALEAVAAGRGADAVERMQEAVALDRELPPPSASRGRSSRQPSCSAKSCSSWGGREKPRRSSSAPSLGGPTGPSPCSAWPARQLRSENATPPAGTTSACSSTGGAPIPG